MPHVLEALEERSPRRRWVDTVEEPLELLADFAVVRSEREALEIGEEGLRFAEGFELFRCPPDALEKEGMVDENRRRGSP